MEDDVEWVLNGESKFPDVFDTLFINISSWSFYSLLAKVCLQLAKRVEIGSEKQHELIKEGLRCLALVDQK